MVPLVQFVRSGGGVGPWARRSLPMFTSMFTSMFAPMLLLCVVSLCSIPARAQLAPPGTVGRLEGVDVTVDGGTPASSATTTNPPGIFVTNGGVVTVHSGQARLTLAGGGQVDICGPAKFTVLQSSDAITLALNFGRMRIQLPASTALRIFTPTIIATPLDISGGPRDLTIGLELNDSLCVAAASGAIQLEHQFSGEKLVVPQAGEFFLAEGKLVPVAGTPGTCQCLGMLARAEEPVQRLPEAGLTAPPVVADPPAPSADATANKPPPIEFSIPAHANEAHPVVPPAKNASPTEPAPTVSNPVYKVVMPPLTFSAASPAPPPDPSPEMILLVRTAQIIPDFHFTGHVDAPSGDTSPSNNHSSQPGPNPQQKKRGFWAALKGFFGSSNATQ
jgi:hypothetical protein